MYLTRLTRNLFVAFYLEPWCGLVRFFSINTYAIIAPSTFGTTNLNYMYMIVSKPLSAKPSTYFAFFNKVISRIRENDINENAPRILFCSSSLACPVSNLSPPYSSRSFLLARLLSLACVSSAGILGCKGTSKRIFLAEVRPIGRGSASYFRTGSNSRRGKSFLTTTSGANPCIRMGADIAHSIA